MFRIALCLPNAAQRRSVQTLCEEYFARRVERLEIAPVPEKKLDALLAADLVFLSAAGGRPNGLDTAQALRQAGGNGAIVFLASGPEYAMEAFEVSATQYFVPPMTEARFVEMLDRLLLGRRGPAFAVPAREGLVRVPYRAIEYVECADHVLYFHLADGSLVASTTLRVPLKTALADLLASPRFYQPHRSYVVNLEHLARITTTDLVMLNGEMIPLSKYRRKSFMEAYAQYRGGTL